jgi:hypothetical protein
MVAKAFSSFSAADAANLATSFVAGAIGFEFLPDTDPAARPNIKLSDGFVNTVQLIKSRWNLDRSEAARRVYVDAFLQEALQDATIQSIITVEENIVDNGQVLGAGYLDYIVAAIAGGKVQYEPSVIIEAKKGMTTTVIREQYQWQLLAEMSSAINSPKVKRDYCYGILTDGRFWSFYTVGGAAGANKLVPVWRSKLYDTEAADNGATQKLVIGALRYWLASYGTGKDAMFNTK